MPIALTITRGDYTAAELREAATRSKTPMQRGGCWRWPWCLKDTSGAKPASSVAWTGRPCATGFYAPTPKESPGSATASSWTETTAHSRAGRGSSRAGSQRTRPCRRWCGSLAPGGSGPRDQGAVQCDLGRAQRRRDAAPPRLSAAVGAAAPSAAGPGGAGDTQKTLPIWSKPSSPSMRAKNRSNDGGRMKPGLVSRAH